MNESKVVVQMSRESAQELRGFIVAYGHDGDSEALAALDAAIEGPVAPQPDDICVKCGHLRNDPGRRGVDAVGSSLCVYGCGCKCTFRPLPEAETVQIVKCQCGDSACNIYGLSDGTFYNGNGWDKERAQQYADAINRARGPLPEGEALSHLDPVGDVVERIWKLTTDRDGWSRIELQGLLELLFARAREVAPEGWLPIANAPTDQRYILGGWWYNDQMWVWGRCEWDGGWFCRDGGKPTHYFPLPAPPSTSVEQDSGKGGTERL